LRVVTFLIVIAIIIVGGISAYGALMPRGWASRTRWGTPSRRRIGNAAILPVVALVGVTWLVRWT
jgi:hypothetical protein